MTSSSSLLLPSGLSLSSISPSENEFFAESTKIIVKSFFEHDSFEFISGRYGPFRIDENTEVPLWLGIALKKKGKCSIIPPKWMLASELEQYIANELASENLTKLDSHYIEIGTLLLIHARDDIESPDKVSALLQDLQNIRMDRLKGSKGLLGVASNSFEGQLILNIPIPNIAALEIDTIRGVMCESLNVMVDLSGQQRPAASTGRRTTNYDDGYDETRSRAAPTGRRFRR